MPEIENCVSPLLSSSALQLWQRAAMIIISIAVAITKYIR